MLDTMFELDIIFSISVLKIILARQHLQCRECHVLHLSGQDPKHHILSVSIK